MKPNKESRRKAVRLIALTAGITALAAAAGVALLMNIFERKQEARNPFYRVVELNDDTVDPAVWGKNFPLQYDGYQRTVDQVRTRYGGSEAVPRTPSQADPRAVVAQSRLEEDPRLKTMWAGYAFAQDFREERGHAYMLADQTFTSRQQVSPQPGTCLNCHASVYTTYKQLGGGDLFQGFEQLNRMPYFEARKRVTHPVACIDCHDAESMQLRVTRPAFIAGMRVLKASQGVPDYDVNKTASRQGRNDGELAKAQDFQRRAQFYLDFVEAENSIGFHAPSEAARILAESINFSRKGQLQLLKQMDR